MAKRILDVGQCGFDGPRLRRVLKEKLDAEVDVADTLGDAVRKAGEARYDLVLVNRQLHVDHSPGLAVIEALRQKHPGLKLMLVSDRPDAQDEAVKAGAVRGFGKAALHAQETVDLIKGALGA